MNYQQLRDLIFTKKPKYSTKFKPLMERISTKGDPSGKGDFTTFGAFYQTFMYAFIIGLRLGKKTPFTQSDEKTDFAPIANWKPSQIRDFILISLLNRCDEFDDFNWNWLSLEEASEENISIFVSSLIHEMEGYANTGLIYLQDKWDNERFIFTSPFVFADLLEDLKIG